MKLSNSTSFMGASSNACEYDRRFDPRIAPIEKTIPRQPLAEIS